MSPRNPWHYVPILSRKPGALRNGAPFKGWVLPAALERVRRKLRGSDDGDRQMVAILSAVLTDGLPAVEGACAEALAESRADLRPLPCYDTLRRFMKANGLDCAATIRMREQRQSG